MSKVPLGVSTTDLTVKRVEENSESTSGRLLKHSGTDIYLEPFAGVGKAGMTQLTTGATRWRSYVLYQNYRLSGHIT